jgi:hypothetical protein
MLDFGGWRRCVTRTKEVEGERAGYLSRQWAMKSEGECSENDKQQTKRPHPNDAGFLNLSIHRFKLRFV